jgi:hypothetical protein
MRILKTFVLHPYHGILVYGEKKSTITMHEDVDITTKLSWKKQKSI